MGTLAALGLSVLALGLVSGCEDNGTPAASTVQNPAPAETTTQTPPTAPTQLSSTAPAAEQTAPTSIRQTPATGDVETGEIPLGPPPPIRFEPPAIELGLLKPGEERTGTVQILNLSDQPLRIVGSRSSCKCTAIDLANVIIPPGESVPLTASMKPDTQSGPKGAKVRVAFEGYDQLAVVDVLAEVALTVRVDPAYLNCAKQLDGTVPPRSGTFKVSSLDGKPFSILASNRTEPDFVDFDPAVDTPRNEYTLRWDLTPYDDFNCDAWPRWWLIETDHPEAPVVDVYVRHMCTVPKKPGTRRWLTISQRALLGQLSPGESGEFDVSLLWVPATTNFGDHVIQVVSRSLDFEAELVSSDYNQEEPVLTLRVTPKEDFRGVIYGVIELHSLHGNMAEYAVIGKVAE